MKYKSKMFWVNIMFRLMVLFGLLSAPPASGAQKTSLNSANQLLQEWVLIYRLGHDVYITDGQRNKLVLENVPLSPQLILSLANPTMEVQKYPISPGYILHSVLKSPNGQSFVYLEKVDLEADFKLWLRQADGQRELLLSQKYNNGVPTTGYMVPIAWTADDVLILHERLMQESIATWLFSLKDHLLRKVKDQVDSIPSPDNRQTAKLQAQRALLLNDHTVAQMDTQVSGAQADSHLEIVGWMDSSQEAAFKQSLQHSVQAISTSAFIYWPLPNNYRNITCGYGCYNYSDGTPHDGIDISTTSAKPEVHAAAHGWVTKRVDGKPDDKDRNIKDSYGNHVIIKHDNGYYTIYAHMKPGSIRVNEGEEVQTNTILGNASNSGNTCGHDPATSGCSGLPGSYYHLHFGVWSCSQSKCSLNPYNPYLWIGNPPNIPDGSAPPQSGPQSNHLPNTPSIDSPGDWNVERNGLAPTLCWKNNGDPDGDRVEFYTEVYNSARDANSSWTNNTCWRPGDLDGGYFNYQWHVKARDSHGAESGWSETRHFSIEAPIPPPSLAFNAANNNNADTIASRDQNWTFTGTADAPKSKLDRVEFHCEGDACNTTQNIGTNNNWSYTRNNLTGQNRIWFVACNDKQQCTKSRTVTLNIDLAAPSTSLSLNNESNPDRWPTWFTSAVQARLHANDGATGNARVGVKAIHYRIDGGGWQTANGGDTTVPVSGDGSHSVEYYAVDNLDNQESSHTVNFKIDVTPPSAPSNASESHGVTNDQWQKAQNTPSFSWGAGSDATSGVAGYEFYFGDNTNGTDTQKIFTAGDALQWTPLSGGVRTGTYYLRGRTRDNAGNASAWVTLFTFRYDGTAPENPTSATHAAGISSSTWQSKTNQADFTWPPPHDEGSGVKGYYVYWGADSEGTTNNFSATAAFPASAPLCAANAACTGYLRLRSEDNVGNQADKWATVFTLQYDGAPPTLDFSFNNGMTQTAQTLVSLNLQASDQGSGVRAMRFSNDGVVWTPWEAYATARTWQIPAIGRQSWPIYAQVQDGVGLVSPVVKHEIYFDVNRPQPHSETMRLFDYLLSAGAGSHASASYQGHSTVGQNLDAGHAGSNNYQLVGGYEAGSRAIPLVIPGHDKFNFINGIFASGVVADTMKSTSYRMLGVIGEVGLPNNTTTVTSSNFQHQPGFLAAAPSGQAIPVPTPVVTPGPTPAPTPQSDCEFPQISINNAKLFTNTPNVTLSICAPHAVAMKISNDGGFANAQWEPYTRSKAWTLTTYGQYVLPRYVYAAFKDADGTIHGTYMDDIIDDPNPPSGNLTTADPFIQQVLLQNLLANNVQAAGQTAVNAFTVGGTTFVRKLGDQVLANPVPLCAINGSGALAVYMRAQDDNSGMSEMQISEKADFAGASWEPYIGLKQWQPTSGDGLKTIYARFRDSAGNISPTTSADCALDSQPPLGGINVSEGVVGANAVNVHLSLEAEDASSETTDMRISSDPNFADANWQPLATAMVWPVQIAAADSEKMIYAQFRDRAGNVSQTYSTSYLVDHNSPLVYAEVDTATALARTVHLYAYDELSQLKSMALTNDPLMIQNVTTTPYTDTVQWTFDDRRVVWIQVTDGAGNVSEPYPAYAALLGDSSSGQFIYLPLVSRTATAALSAASEENPQLENHAPLTDTNSITTSVNISAILPEEPSSPQDKAWLIYLPVVGQ